jgi:hypothetical protein
MFGNKEAILLSLDIMWKGMLGIFAVILIITFFVIFIQWLEKKFPEKSSKN